MENYLLEQDEIKPEIVPFINTKDLGNQITDNISNEIKEEVEFSQMLLPFMFGSEANG